MADDTQLPDTSFRLSEFPRAFEPLVVVVGDRRERRPKNVGDVLVNSVSTIDLMFLSKLGLARDTLIVTDKIFLTEDKETLADRFRRYNILTIGSPAVNLFSRIINDQSLFRFSIDEQAKAEMEMQRRIVQPYKRDRRALEFYMGIVTGNVTTLDEFDLWSGQDHGGYSEADQDKFYTLLTAVNDSGLKSYKALLNNFAGKGITDPVNPTQVAPDFDRPKLHGFKPEPDKDFGMVSLAAHPYSDSKCVIYAAGMHGPASAYALLLLGNAHEWLRFPYGGVFELVIPQDVGWSHRLQESIKTWQTKRYDLLSDFEVSRIPRPKQRADWRVFISLPMNGPPAERARLPILALKKHDTVNAFGRAVEWIDPFSLPKGTWEDFRSGIRAHFPKADFVIHDITGLSPGVMFEVGCSRGLDRKKVLLWDTSRRQFDLQRLPPILRNGVHIESVDFTDPRSLCSVVIDCMKAEIENAEARPSAKEPPVDSSGTMVLCSPTCKMTMEASLRNQLFSWNKGRVVWDTPLSLSELYAAMAASAHVIVASHAEYAEGNLALGLARTMDKRVIEFYLEGDAPCSMYDGLRKHWTPATLDIDVQDGLTKLFR